MIEVIIGFVSEYGLAIVSGSGTYRAFMDERPFFPKAVYGGVFLGSIAYILNLV